MSSPCTRPCERWFSLRNKLNHEQDVFAKGVPSERCRLDIYDIVS